MEALRGGAVSYERGTPVPPGKKRAREIESEREEGEGGDLLPIVAPVDGRRHRAALLGAPDRSRPPPLGRPRWRRVFVEIHL